MTTGARRGELCGLRRRHVDLDNAAITLRTASARSARGYGKRTPERPLAWTRPSRHTLAGVTATALNHTTGSPDLIFPAPSTTIPDRPSPSEPSHTGHDSAEAGTATMTPHLHPAAARRGSR